MTDVRNHCLHTELIYDVAVIDPSNSSNEQSNLIALCPECAAKYAALKTPDDIARMTKKKKRLSMLMMIRRSEPISMCRKASGV